jgi:hypothetical protein
MIGKDPRWKVLALLVATNCGGGATGVLPPAPPVIERQPEAVTVSACGDATFRTAVTGAMPIALQWLRDGVAIPGATSATYQLFGAVPGDSGAVFTAVATSPWGTAGSSGAALTVVGAPPTATAPILLAEEYFGGRIAVAGDTVAWSAGIAVHATPLPCGKPLRSLYERGSSAERTDGIALTPGQVVWTDSFQGAVWTAPLAGGPARQLVGGLSTLGPMQVALAGDRLWWTTHDVGLQTMALAGGDLTTIAPGPPGSMEVDGIAVDNRYVYWEDLGQRTVNRMALGGGEVLVLADSATGLTGALAADGQSVYWAEMDASSDPETGRVHAVSRDGGTSRLLATQGTTPLSMAVDGTHLYWTSNQLYGPPGSFQGSGKMTRVRLDGSEPPEVIAAGINPFGIAVDDQRLYWTEGMAGSVRVWMLAK